MSGLAKQLKANPIMKRPKGPLWAGPSDPGPSGGVTQSMLQRFLCCRERFRIRYCLGLEPSKGWVKPIGFGNMWHVCEEAAAAKKDFQAPLVAHVQQQCLEYPFERETILHWATICGIQFPCYLAWWKSHPDEERLPLLQEEEFRVKVTLPSGREVYLRGKWDSVDFIPEGENAGIWLMENKTKSKIDEAALRRQLKFDLQTMTYLLVLREWMRGGRLKIGSNLYSQTLLRGVRYNVIRRDMPIRQHKPSKSKPSGESEEAYYSRFKKDYLDAEPAEWFKRWNSKVTNQEIDRFRDECLFPFLEQLCDWYAWVVETCMAQGLSPYTTPDRKGFVHSEDTPAVGLHWRAPFGVYDPIKEQGATEYDTFIESGNESGLVYRGKLFPELSTAL